MRQMVQKLIPMLRKRSAKNKRSNSSPLFGSYEEALDACGTEGYQASDLVKVVVEKNIVYRNQIYSSRTLGLDSLRTMIGIGALQSLTTLRVLDFGGGGGYHYSIARAALGPDRDIRWNVVETAAMAKAAGKHLTGDGLKFFDNIQDAAADLGSVDLVFSSGSLQYTPDPLAFLSTLVDLGAGHLFITRTPLSDGSDQVITVQSSWISGNGPGPLPPGIKDCEIRYPVTFASRPRFLELIEKAYCIRFFLDEGRFSHPMEEGMVLNMYGYFGVLKK